MKIIAQNIWSIGSAHEVYNSREEALQHGVLEDVYMGDGDGEDNLFLVRVVLQNEIPHPMSKDIRFEDLLLAFIKSRSPQYEKVTSYVMVGAGWSCQVDGDVLLVELTDLLIWLWIRSAK